MDREQDNLGPERDELLKKSEYTIGLISDTQDLDNPEKIISKFTQLKGIKPDMIIHTGDVYTGRLKTELVKTMKQILSIREGLTPGELTQDQESEYQEITNSDSYKRDMDKGLPRLRAYLNCLLVKKPEIQKQDGETERENITKILQSLKKLGVPIKHIMGNADISEEARKEVILDQENQLGIENFSEPQLLDLGEIALIIWPFQNFNPNTQKDISEKLLAKTQELAGKTKNKKQIVIFGHEHIFKGPVAYMKKASEVSQQTPRLPRLQSSPSRNHILYLMKQISPQIPITYIFGHLHDPKEIVEAGMPYIKGDQGKYRFRLPGSFRKINMIYLPQGEIGLLKINSQGVEFEEI